MGGRGRKTASYAYIGLTAAALRHDRHRVGFGWGDDGKRVWRRRNRPNPKSRPTFADGAAVGGTGTRRDSHQSPRASAHLKGSIAQSARVGGIRRPEEVPRPPPHVRGHPDRRGVEPEANADQTRSFLDPDDVGPLRPPLRGSRRRLVGHAQGPLQHLELRCNERIVEEVSRTL
jgi:hypothetical protein